ncbi:MAG: hypothetical protein ACOX4D_06825 [Bacteroidales bacterium]
MLPNKIIRKNIANSVETLVEAKEYPRVIINDHKFRLDNFTDALILNQAYNSDRKNLIESVLLVPRSTKHNMSSTLSLQYLVTEQDFEPILYYPRYWHGNTFLVRYLLLIGNYDKIRVLLYLISSLMIIFLGAKLYQRTNLLSTLLFFLGFFSTNIFISQFSIQFFPVLMLTLIFSIFLCKPTENHKQILLLFFIFGSLTSYFDLLTTPILTLCIPLIVYFMVNQNKQNDEPIFLGIKKIFSSSILWAMGYAFTWFSKWVITNIFTSYNAIKNGFNSVLIRSSGSVNNDFSRIDAIKINLELFDSNYILIVTIFVIIIATLYFNKKGLKTSLMYVLIGLIPLVWYFVLANHSYIHFWYTYRSLMVTFICIPLIFNSLIDFNKPTFSSIITKKSAKYKK